MAQEHDSGSTGSEQSISPKHDPNQAFKSRLEKFKYSHPPDMNGQRRSPRFAHPHAYNAHSNSASYTASPRKRSRQTLDSPVGTGTTNDGRAKGESSAETSVSGDSPMTPSLKKRRSTTKERSARDPYSPTNNLVDSLRPGLTLVCIGLNPGLMTASTGHAYAHPSNRFWHILHSSGITPKKHLPSETRDLMDLYRIGNTNICARPTRSGDGLSKLELEEGAVILEEKIAQFRPEAVVIVGKGIWEAIWMAKKAQKKFNDPDFRWGWQDEEMQIGRTKHADGGVGWAGAKTFVATSTSGLAATLTPAEKLAIWKPLGDWMMAKRERGESG